MVLCSSGKEEVSNVKRNVNIRVFSTSWKIVSWVSLAAQCGGNNGKNLNDVYIFELSWP